MTAPLYRADPDHCRIAMALDGMTLIFHRPSGITHVVAAPVPELLDALAAGPADAGELLRRLAAAHDLGGDGGGDPESAAIITARLAEMEAAGLVARA